MLGHSDYATTANIYSRLEKSLYSRLLRHRKRTVTLYQNYGSYLAERVGFEPTSLRGHHDFE